MFNFVHGLFDFFAVACSLLFGWLVYQWRFRLALQETVSELSPYYFLFLTGGSVLGSYVLGTINLYLSDIHVLSRSIVGALFGAIICVEVYKYFRGVRRSTGYMYVIPFCVLVIVGRVGCLLSGMDDNTHGIPTGLAYGWDYGDGILRHPVQLYESLLMFLFVMIVIFLLSWHSMVVIRYGFYLCVFFYAAQRFLLEFLKPYSDVLWGLNIFQFVCLVLCFYSIFMVVKGVVYERRA